MEVIEKVDEIQDRCRGYRQAGKILALVPTMGFFHEGHLELMRAGKRLADLLIVSIFVNPTQFGPHEDLAQYPRDLEGDLKKAAEVGVDIAFVPSPEEMYPEGFQTTVAVRGLSEYLCGLSRPGHFEGVTTVVAKLFHITGPHIAVFGQKDYQQLTVITRMVRDLNMDIRIVGVPTVREPDGLARSSRNAYLTPEQRASAPCLKKALDLAREMVVGGEKRSAVIGKAVEKLILSHPHTEIDYVNLCHPDTLEEVENVEEETLLALAVRVGKTRLIDNCLLNRGGKV